MKEALYLHKIAGFSILLLGLVAGCGRKSEPNTTVQVPKEQTAANTIQGEIDLLPRRPHEASPTNRPLVLSERAPGRKQWLLGVLKKGYLETGHTNKAWDAEVYSALAGYASYAREGGSLTDYSKMTNGLRRALSARCDDPVMRYMEARYLVGESGASKEQIAIALLRAHRVIFESRYHPALKFTAGFRAVNAARDADVKGKRTVLVEYVTMSLEDLARDTNAPPEEVFEPALWWVEHTNTKDWLDFILGDLQPILERNWSKDEGYFRLRGLTEINRAWADRGGGFAETVSEKGWEGFRKHLEAAEPLLQEAWRLNPTNAQTAYLMMRLELGQGRGRERMEQWLDRAMKLDPNYYDAAQLMSFYLEPRWYGSEGDALEFGRRCVTTTNWGGTVPLVLADLHHSLARFYKVANAPEYWQQRPHVWKDIRASYERFFEANPDAVGYRHNYARDAYLCGQYSEFLAQTKLFGGSTNYAYFGGQTKFGEMLVQAQAASDGGKK